MNQATFWDEFLQDYQIKIEYTTPRDLLEAFYHWLRKRGALKALDDTFWIDQGGAGDTRIDGG